MPDLIQQANDLKNAPDQWLVGQAQRPTSPVPPYLILAELHRRQLLRAGGAGMKPPTSSVMQDTLRGTLDQLMQKPTPGPPPPVGMTPPPQKPPGGAMGTPMPGATPPQNQAMPPKPMAAGGNVGGDDWSPEDIEDELNAAEQRYQLPQGLLRSIASTESGRNPRTRPSSKGAIGIMQLMPGTAKDLGVDPYDVQQNIDGGGRYLRQQLDRFGGDVPKALAAYNAGPGAVKRFGGIPPYPETQNYVQRNQRMLSKGMASTLFPVAPAPTAAATPAPGTAFTPEPAAAGNAPSIPGLEPTFTPPAPPAGPGAPIRQAMAPVEEDPTVEPYRLTLEAAKKTLAGLRNDESYKPHRPEDAYSIVNQNKADIEALLGPRPDYSRDQAAITRLQAQAEQDLHPNIWQTLQQLGAGILSSRGANFAQDFGAGMTSMLGHQEKQRQQARANYVQALKAGYDLQGKIDTYDTKVATLKMAQVRNLQSGWEAESKDHAAQVREAANDVDRAQLNFDKATASSPDAKRAARQREVDNYHIAAGLPPGQYDEREAGYIQYADTKAARPTALTKFALAAFKAGVDISKGPLSPADATKVQEELDKAGQIILSDDEVKEYAKQYRTLGTLPQLGQGSAGRMARQAILSQAARDARAENLSFAESISSGKATQGALKNRSDQLANIEAFERTALGNMDIMLKAAQPIIDAGSRWINTPLRAVQIGALSAPELAAYNAARQVALIEFAKVTQNPGLGGALTNEAREEIMRLIPENASLKEIYAATNILKQDAATRHRELTNEVDYLQKKLATPGGSILSGPEAPTPPEPGGKPAVAAQPESANAPATGALPQGGGKPIDRETGRKFLEAAGGDPVKARALAQQYGWTATPSKPTPITGPINIGSSPYLR